MGCAIVEITPEVLRDAIGVIEDHGIRITGSIASTDLRPFVRLTVEGDCLPEPGPRGMRRVTFVITTETYGRQRINRVSEIKVLED